MPTALHSLARVLIVLHALAAMALLGASTHATVVTVAMLRGHDKARLSRVYSIVVAGAYVVTMMLGALAYPTYRYEVRGLYLDRYATWASNLFDIKENFATLGLPLAIAAMVLRGLDLESDRRPLPPYALFVVASTAIVWFATVSGLVVTLVRAP